MEREIIAEVYANSLYSYEPTIQVARWWIPGFPILVGGSLIDVPDFQHLHERFGITHVVNVETEHDDSGKVPEELLLQIRVPDDGSPIPAEFIERLIGFARQDRVLYVHCQMGGSRSPAFAYALLRGYHGLSRVDALAALNRGFRAKTQDGHEWGLHPVHQAYIASVDRAIELLPA